MTQGKPDMAYSQFQSEHVGYDQGPQVNYAAQGQAVPQVMVQPNAQIQNFTVEAAAVKWSWCNLITSVFALCCCQIFGIIAVITSILAYVDHKSKDFERSRNKRNVAWGFGISGIVIGSIIIVGLIIGLVFVGAAATDAVTSGINQVNSLQNDYSG